MSKSTRLRYVYFFFSSRRRHTRFDCDWSSDVCSSDLGTVAEARRLWAAVARTNVMIKVPGTREGWSAIERLLTDGINVNITLLFSLEQIGRASCRERV